MFNHDLANDAGVKIECDSDGTTANTSHTLTCFSNECTVAYKVVLAEDSHAVDTETITIDKPYDPAKGRVFLIDMKVAPLAVTQLNLELPADVPSLTATDATQEFGRATLTALREGDTTVDDFCQRATAEGT